MNVHILPVHKQNIKYSSVLLTLHDFSMVEYRKIRTISFSKMEVNIVIFIATINLFPDAGVYLLLLIFTDQIAKPLFCEFKEFINILITRHMKKFMV